MQNTVTKSTAKIPDVCNLKATVTAMKASGDKRLVVGAIIGSAVDFVKRADPKGGDPLLGFMGNFEIIPTDKAMDITQSGVLFLPDAFHAGLETALRKVLFPNAEKPDVKSRGGSISFGARILVVAAENATGYSWGLDYFREPASTDPLGELRGMIPAVAAGTAATDKGADPAGAGATSDKPASAKGKGK